jgi:diguanylate cyclase (GGDEF)-like protein
VKRSRGRETVREGFTVRALTGAGSARVPVLVVLNGPQIGERRRLDGAIDIGRDPSAGLVLRDPDVAWRHVRIGPTADGWTVTDLGASSGVRVRGVRVLQHLLQDDDTIVLGSTVLRFELHDEVEQAFDEAVQERLWRDDLTGLYSRRKFEFELANGLDAIRVQGGHVGLAILDVDQLKAINDEHGHLVGARVIAAVGHAIGDALPAGAFACRLGGDEFAVALSGDIDDVERLAHQLAQRVGGLRIRHGERELSVTVSAGVAVAPEQGTVPEALMRAADDALLRAKRDGRRRVAR